MDLWEKDGKLPRNGGEFPENLSDDSEKCGKSLSDLVNFSDDYNSGLYYCLMRNYLMAKCCFERAAQNGDERAKRYLAKMKDEGLI